MGFTCGTFDLELVKLDVMDCVHDRNWHVLMLYSLRVLFAKPKISSEDTLGAKMSTCVHSRKDGRVV
jgi:hypothetical protein